MSLPVTTPGSHVVSPSRLTLAHGLPVARDAPYARGVR
jgi:hypothetical protein